MIDHVPWPTPVVVALPVSKAEESPCALVYVFRQPQGHVRYVGRRV